MSRIFISHSSRNNAEALALRDWLVAQGYDDIFLDLDNIVSGAKWRRALAASMQRCKAVIYLISEHWVNSEECKLEYAAARDANETLPEAERKTALHAGARRHASERLAGRVHHRLSGNLVCDRAH